MCCCRLCFFDFKFVFCFFVIGRLLMVARSWLQRTNASVKVPMPKVPEKAEALRTQKKGFLTPCVCLAYSPNKQVQLEEQIFTPPAKEKEIPAVTPFSKIQLAANKRLQAAEQNGKAGQKKKKVDGNKGKGTQKKTKVDGKGTQTKKKGKGKGTQTKKKGDGKDTQTKKKGKGNDIQTERQGDKAGMSICVCMLLHMF